MRLCETFSGISANGSHDAPVFLFEQCMRYVFIRFVSVVPYYSGSACKLAVSDGWAQVGNGWANVCSGPPMATPVAFVCVFRVSLHIKYVHMNICNFHI